MVYPNPTSGVIHVQNSDEIGFIEVYRTSKLLPSKKNSNNIVDLSHFDSGVYIIKMIGCQETINQKVIKK